MTNRVTITLHLDLPDGVIPDVQYATAVAEKPIAAAYVGGTPDQEFPAFPEGAASPPLCKVHGSPMKPSTKPGTLFYCNKKVGDGWCKETVKA